jgi:integrase
MFSIAVDNNYLQESPCKKIKKLQADNIKIRFLTKEEQKLLFKEIKGEYKFLKPIVVMALQTGMRKGEILALEWRCVDLQTGYIEILNSKTGKSRKIPISEKLKKELYLLDKETEFVFTNPNTKKPYWDIKREFKQIVDLAKIKNFTFHDLRHTAATRMVENNVDLVVVQEILGHEHIQTTMRYAHPVPERKKRAIEILNKY